MKKEFEEKDSTTDTAEEKKKEAELEREVNGNLRKKSGVSHEENHHHSHSGHRHRHHRNRKPKRKNFALEIAIIIVVCILILALMGLATFAIIRYIGGKNLAQNATTQAPVMVKDEEPETEPESEIELKEGEILHNGKIYRYNSDIRTFAIMGIDTESTVEELIKEELGGQSDMNMLVVLNPHIKKLQIITINRNTMTDIQRYAVDGTYIDTVPGQITLQHAYGTGGTDSCEKMVSAIDNVMYMIPIHGYFAMNMGAITKLNDAVGGVTLTAIEDVVHKGTEIHKGDKVNLLGKDAFWYTKYRDFRIAGTADKRLERQKQYLAAFLNKTKDMVKNDLSLPVSLYQIVAEYSVTDLTPDKMTYLASEAVNYTFDMDNIYDLPGKTVPDANNVHEEFHVDEKALYDMIVEIFYEPVE